MSETNLNFESINWWEIPSERFLEGAHAAGLQFVLEHFADASQYIELQRRGKINQTEAQLLLYIAGGMLYTYQYVADLLQRYVAFPTPADLPNHQEALSWMFGVFPHIQYSPLGATPRQFDHDRYRALPAEVDAKPITNNFALYLSPGDIRIAMHHDLGTDPYEEMLENRGRSYEGVTIATAQMIMNPSIDLSQQIPDEELLLAFVSRMSRSITVNVEYMVDIIRGLHLSKMNFQDVLRLYETGDDRFEFFFRFMLPTACEESAHICVEGGRALPYIWETIRRNDWSILSGYLTQRLGQ